MHVFAVLLCVLLATGDEAPRSRFVLANILSLDRDSGIAELAARGHGLLSGQRTYVLTDAGMGLEIDVLSVDLVSLEVRFAQGLYSDLSEGDRVSLYCGELSSPTEETTPDRLPPPVIPPSSTELELLFREAELQLDLLRADMAAAALAEATAVEFDLPGQPWKWSHRGHLRTSIEWVRYVNRSPLGLNTSDPQAALDELDERITDADPIVTGSGSLEARALLDEAIQLRNEAATVLTIDPDLAILLIEIAAYNVDEAVRLAGGSVPPQNAEERVDAEEHGYIENYNRWETRSAGGIEIAAGNRLRYSDRYLQDQLNLDLRRHGDAGWSLRPDLFWTRYTDSPSDDNLAARLDGEVYRDVLGDRLRLALGERLYYRTEYDAVADDGYRTLQGYGDARWRLSRAQALSVRVAHARQRYLRDQNEDFDYDENVGSLTWERYAPGSGQYLQLEGRTRDYNQADDEDDYDELRLLERLFWVPAPRWYVYQDGTFTLREYAAAGEENTDYGRAESRAGIEVRPWTWSAFALEGALDAVRYDDEDGGDALVKERGDFDEWHSLARVTLLPHEGWELQIEAGRDWRRYRKEETGAFELWLSADFSPVADFDRDRLSASLRGDLSKRTTLVLTASHDEQRFRTYTEYDTTHDLLQLQLTWRY